MSKTLKNALIKYGIAVLVCGLMVWWMIYMNGYSTYLPTIIKYRILCDAFTVPGLLTLNVGILVWISTKGGLDALSWAVTNMVFSLIPGMAYKRESYGDYKERKNANRAKGYGFLMLTGLAFLVIALVFGLLYMKLDPEFWG